MNNNQRNSNLYLCGAAVFVVFLIGVLFGLVLFVTQYDTPARKPSYPIVTGMRQVFKAETTDPRDGRTITVSSFDGARNFILSAEGVTTTQTLIARAPVAQIVNVSVEAVGGDYYELVIRYLPGDAREGESLAEVYHDLYKWYQPKQVAPTPEPTPEPVTEFIAILTDPRSDGGEAAIEIRGKFGEYYATAQREIAPHSEVWQKQALPFRAKLVDGLVFNMTTDDDGKPALEIDYSNGTDVFSEIYTLDKWLPIKHLAPDAPTATPEPPRYGDEFYFRVQNAGGLGMILSGRNDYATGAAVLSLREFDTGGALYVDDLWIGSTVYEIRGAEMQDDGYVLIRYGTSAQGGDVVVRHRPWFREVPTTVNK